MKPYFETELGKLYHGDCIEIMPNLLTVDLVITDPPYNVGKNYGVATNDRKGRKEYWEWLSARLNQIAKKLTNGYLYISHSDKGVYELKPVLEQLGFEFVQHLIWWGKNGYSAQLHERGWSFRHELIPVYRKGGYQDLVVGIKGMPFTTVLEVVRPQSNFKEGRFHPTQKPIMLYQLILQRTPATVTLDPFSGSATTAIACERLNRSWVCIEIEEKYCEIAAKRIEHEREQLKLFN